jgi:hypothetical protein
VPRGFDIEDCNDVVAGRLNIRRLIAASAPLDPDTSGAGINWLNCNDVTMSNSYFDTGDQYLPGVLVQVAEVTGEATSSRAVTVSNTTVKTNYADAAGSSRQAFRAIGATGATFDNCTHDARGAGSTSTATNKFWSFGFHPFTGTLGPDVPCTNCSLVLPRLQGSDLLVSISNGGGVTATQKSVNTHILLDPKLCLLGTTYSLFINDGGVNTTTYNLANLTPDPLSTTGLVGYFDARQSTVAYAAGIASLVGAPGTATQGTAGLQPLYSANRFRLAILPGIAFDGVDDRLPTDVAMPTSTVTVACVVRLTNFAVNRVISQTRSATTGLKLITTSSGLVRLLKGATTLATGTTALTADTPALVTVTVDIPNLAYVIRVNGIAAGSGALAGGTTLDAGSLDLGDATMLGSIGAYAVWSRVLATAELEKVEARLKVDWGL